MADEADKGNETAAFFLEVALRQNREAAIPRGVGHCLNCGAEVTGDKRWCDTACRDDYDTYTKGH